MAAVRPGAATVTVVRAPLVKDPRSGAFARDWTNPTRTQVRYCSVQSFPLAEKLNFEVMDSREYARSSLRVYAPAGTDVEPTDRIEYRGKTYEVFGHAAEWFDLGENPHHVAFVIRIRTG